MTSARGWHSLASQWLAGGRRAVGWWWLVVWSRGCDERGEATAGRQAGGHLGWHGREPYNTRSRDTMAHKIGLNDTQYEPDICGAVDFSFFDEDDSDVERTKGLAKQNSETVVKEKRHSVVVVSAPPSSSSSSSTHHHHHHKNSVISQQQQSSSSTSSRSSSRFVEDVSLGGLTKEKEKEEEQEQEQDTGLSDRRRRLQLAEGQLEPGEEMRNGHRASFGSSTSERGTLGSTSSLEAHEPNHFGGGDDDDEEASGAVMEGHVDQYNTLYSSDEWDEESNLSDTDGDHSDSSDDDDPKSQVDRLIERGTLMYMDGENSNLSSEESSDDDASSDYDDDSESDITDVSPLISATASPLGLSPVLPRRTLGTSPLALHDNRDLAIVDFSRHEVISSNDQGYDSQPHCNGSSHSNSDDSTDMTLLLKAVVELEKKQKRNHLQQNNRSAPNNRYSNRHYHKNRTNSSHHHHHHHHHEQDNHLHTHPNNQIADAVSTSTPIPIHPIDASPHHSHLRRAPHPQAHRRKNMSFSNDEVRRIDRDNQILLKKIMSVHARTPSSSNQNNRTVHRPANSTVNRRREEEKIRRENMILLRKLQEARPSRDVTASRSPRHRTTHGVRPPSSLPATPGSIGASARTA